MTFDLRNTLRTSRTALVGACLALGLVGAHAAGYSPSFIVTGDVTATTTFDLAALQNSPLTKITETIGANTYVGVSFWELLTVTVGVPVDVNIKNNILDKYVVAAGSDGYQSLFSMGELSPNFANQPDIIAFQLNGAPIATDGFARVVVPHDVRQGRWVSNLVSLTVGTVPPLAAVPEPASAALMLVGMAAIGGLARRRRSQH